MTRVAAGGVPSLQVTVNEDGPTPECRRVLNTLASSLERRGRWPQPPTTGRQVQAYHQPSTFHQASPMPSQMARWYSDMMKPILNHLPGST